MQSAINVLAGMLAVLLTGKLIEMCLHSPLPRRSPDKLPEWPITKLIQRLPGPWDTFFKVLFNHKVLILLFAALAIFVRTEWARWLCGTFLFAGAWIGIYRLLADKFAFGDEDARHRQWLAAVARVEVPRLKLAKKITPRRFSYFDAYLLAGAVAIAYTGLFSAIAAGDVGCWRTFDHVSGDLMRAIDLLYFSIVTMGTVGFGDIIPSSNGTHIHLIRLLVASEIIAGFLILTVFFVRIEPDEAANQHRDLQ
ncbi:MAG TPA: ion channel [Chthoniobacterales bacterium]|jgi:hypothetical protein|nr:ion channel [Chthoniobacterales bacterium]